MANAYWYMKLKAFVSSGEELAATAKPLAPLAPYPANVEGSKTVAEPETAKTVHSAALCDVWTVRLNVTVRAETVVDAIAEYSQSFGRPELGVNDRWVQVSPPPVTLFSVVVTFSPSKAISMSGELVVVNVPEPLVGHVKVPEDPSTLFDAPPGSSARGSAEKDPAGRLQLST